MHRRRAWRILVGGLGAAVVATSSVSACSSAGVTPGSGEAGADAAPDSARPTFDCRAQLCPNEPAPTDAAVAQCEAAKIGPCGAAYDALVGCILPGVRCTSEGKVDVQSVSDSQQRCTAALAQYLRCSTDAASPQVDGSPPQPGVAERPPGPEGPPTSSTTTSHYAITRLFLGDVTRAGAPSVTAWKQYGYDLDGRTSRSTSTDHCGLERGASSRVREDGEGGRDNSFGANILPIFTTASPDLSAGVQARLTAGEVMLVEVTGLDGTAGQTNTGLSGQLFETAKPPTPPRFDRTDAFDVLPGWLRDGTLGGGSSVRFSNAHVTRGVLVGSVGGTLTVNVPMGSVPIALSIERAVITLDVRGGELVGTIAGVIPVQRMVDALRTVAGHVSTTLCEGSTFENIASQIRQAADIRSDGTNGDPALPCEAISIGLGFVARPVAPPRGVAPAPPVVPDPCK